MEELAAEAVPAAPRARRSMPNIFNLLAGVLLVFSCLNALCMGLIFAVPGIVPAPFQPPTLPALAQLPTLAPTSTATSTSAVPTFPPTWTPTNTPTASTTPGPTSTQTETPTVTQRGPTFTPTKTRTPTRTPSLTPSPGPSPTPSLTRSPFSYTLQPGSPTYLANFANTAGCRWQGIAGQAFDLTGKPVVGLLVHLEGGGLNYDVVTGSKPAYGQGGYELFITDTPRTTTTEYRVQLRNTAGAPLSDVHVIPTFSDCTKNLALVNFVQNH